MSVDRLMRWRTLRPLRNRDYRLLLSTVGLSLFGTGVWTIVMVFQVFAIDDSPLALSAVATGLSLGLFAFAILGGVIADRFSKRAVIIAVQGANTVALTAVAVLSLAGLVELCHLAAASFVIGAGSAFFYPAYSAYLPQVLEADELLAANGLEGAVRPTVQQGLGPALGGLIVGAFFPAAGAAVVAVAIAAAFIVTLFLSRREPFIAEDTDVPAQSVLADLREGMRYVVTTRWLGSTLLFGSTLALVIQGPIAVLLPFLTRERFSNPELSFGLLLAAYGIGGAVGSLVVSSWKLPRRYLTIMLLCWGGGALPLVLLGISDSFAIMAAVLFLVGGTSGVGIVIWGTLLQRRVPANMIGRVASLDFFVSIAFMPLSIAIAGPLSLVLPAEVIFVIAGLVPPALALLAITAGRMCTDERAHPLDKT